MGADVKQSGEQFGNSAKYLRWQDKAANQNFSPVSYRLSPKRLPTFSCRSVSSSQFPISRALSTPLTSNNASACCLQAAGSGRLRPRKRILRERQVVQVASRDVAVASRAQRRLLRTATIKSVGAARVKAASRGRIDGARHIALEDDASTGRSWLRYRYRGKQGLRVGMLRRPEELAFLRQFDDFAEVHHGHAVRHVLDDGEVVTDEQHREPELLLQVRAAG